jgi:hypothetical protein
MRTTLHRKAWFDKRKTPFGATAKTPKHKTNLILRALVSLWLFICGCRRRKKIPPARKCGVDLAPLEKMRAAPARTAAGVLPKLMKDLRMDDRRAEAELVKVWNSLIDPTLTAHAQPHNLHKGTLFVNVDSNVWLTEIVRYRRREILDRLQHSFGKNLIQKISFRIG